MDEVVPAGQGALRELFHGETLPGKTSGCIENLKLMCGIAGILTSRPLAERGLPLAGGGRLSPDEALERMVRHLRHRGPDDEGQIVLYPETCTIGFAHVRLAILDLSPSGHQPMADPAKGNWITYNGEIYNYKSLRRKLDADEPWNSRSDTEIILKAYARWGREFLTHLRGMFAFAIWDS